MSGILVVYTTRTGKTKKIAESILEGASANGAEVKLVDAKQIKNESDLDSYDAYVFGSPTYHGEMMQSMKTTLFIAEKANLEGKVGGAFGAFGWSGEAPERIYNTVKNIFKMDMVSNFLKLKSTSAGGLQTAQAYGQEIAQKLNA